MEGDCGLVGRMQEAGLGSKPCFLVSAEQLLTALSCSDLCNLMSRSIGADVAFLCVRGKVSTSPQQHSSNLNLVKPKYCIIISIVNSQWSGPHHNAELTLKKKWNVRGMSTCFLCNV